MNPVFIYLLGVITPFLAFLAINIYWESQERREHRRYQRAWDKFTKEYDMLSDKELASFAATKQPWDNYCDEQSRYFASRWRHGMTNEV